MMARLSPCLDCKKRYVGCHGKCADYLDYADERRTVSEARRKEQDYITYQRTKSAKIAKLKKRERED